MTEYVTLLVKVSVGLKSMITKHKLSHDVM